MSNRAEKQGAVPWLRFPGFEEEVTALPLDALADFVNEKVSVDQVPVEKYVSTENLLPDFAGLSAATKLPSVLSMTSFRPKDILISNIRPYLKKVWQSDIQGGASNDVLVVRAKKSMDADYLAAMLRSDLFIDYVMRSAKGVKMPRGDISMIGEFLVPCLSRAEKQKIADCLSSFDACIGAEARKLDALKAHKQGLMQQLFPAEGQRLPRLRFPAFEGEWKSCDLGGKAVKVGSGVTPTGGQQVYKPFGRPFVRSQNVGWGELLLDDIAFIDDATHASFASTELMDQDVLLNITGASIGRSAIADGRVVGGNVNQHVCIIRPIAGALDPVFLNQFFISQLGQNQIDSFQAGGNRQGLNFAQIRSLTVPLPPTFAEQRRISSCLSSLDALIARQSCKITALQQHKKRPDAGHVPGHGHERRMSAAGPFADLPALATHLRTMLDGPAGHPEKAKRFVLLYGQNGVGKTQLSMAFRSLGRRDDDRDTLYFNAYTEDLFGWDNDLVNDSDCRLVLNASSRFFAGLGEMEMDNRIRPLLQRYVDFDFQIDTTAWAVRFYRRDNLEQPIKISRGEETMFIWCFFLAIMQLAMDAASSDESDASSAYGWVKYIVIDDPISSLDEHNAIVVANHLAQLLARTDHAIKTVISTHHPLFFNVLWNEIKNIDQKKFSPCLMSRAPATGQYTLTYTRDTPFFHHLALLQDLCHARQSGQIYTHHFNALRGLLEKAQIFHGHDKFSVCINQDAADDPGATLYGRVVNIMSHGNYSFYDPVEMLQENKEHFEKVLDDFLAFYPFNRAERPGTDA